MAGPRLAFMRARQTRFMPERCTRTRPGAADLTTVCSVQRESGAVQPIPTDRLQPERRWVISLPHGTDVQRGDTLQALGERYTVVEEDGPHTDALTVRVICLKQGAVRDDVETPAVDEATDDLIHANATVVLQRFSFDPGTRHTTLQAAGTPFAARVDDLSTQLAAEGEGPSFAIQISCAGSVDIRDGDVVASIDPPLATLPALAQVRHVEIKRVNVGLTYKVAMVTELPQAGGTP